MRGESPVNSDQPPGHLAKFRVPKWPMREVTFLEITGIYCDCGKLAIERQVISSA
jgi:hypothetical protein